MNQKKFLFPFSSVRSTQDMLIKEVNRAVRKGEHLIVHAPTGLGKTSATLCPALAYSLRHNKTVFFLTSRHTQHSIAIETLKRVRTNYKVNFLVTDIIGKKWMCPIAGTEKLYSNEFSDYCRALREENQCEFFYNTKTKDNKLSVKAKKIVDELKHIGPFHNEELVKFCSEEKLCPYEIAAVLSAQSNVVVCDYYYMFNPQIREMFLKKIKKELSDIILIIDEGHNLPSRIRELLTERLSSITVLRAINEATKHGYKETRDTLTVIYNALVRLADEVNHRVNNSIAKEGIIPKQRFVNEIENDKRSYDEIVAELSFIGEEVLKQQKLSYISRISTFLQLWLGEDTGFARILSVNAGTKGNIITLSYCCLDPSVVTKDVVEASHSTILMSGTLTPTSMYKDILGFPDKTIQKEYPSQFPSENRLVMIVPETTTRYTKRTEYEYMKISKLCNDIISVVPGNIAVFFPSYALLDRIYYHIQSQCEKKLLKEKPNMTKKEKEEFLESFKSNKKKGAVLLGVASGSFGEGIDLPGELLKAVVIVGLPLNIPDLYTMELIDYYDKKFGRGWDYGYILPAITKSLQNAGRCIRSETDRGAIVFLDERYSWPKYKKCFPSDWDVKVTKLYIERLREFFSK